MHGSNFARSVPLVIRLLLPFIKHTTQTVPKTAWKLAQAQKPPADLILSTSLLKGVN